MAAEDSPRSDQQGEPAQAEPGAPHGDEGRSVATHGGAYVEGEVRTGGGDFAGRDLRRVSAETYIENVTLVSSSIGAGMSALGEMAQSSQPVRAAVQAFLANFKAARDQIVLLGDYKDLHDLLHQLQFHCFGAIRLAAPGFPEEETSLGNLMQYQPDLETITARAHKVVERGNLTAQDEAWLQDLAEARDLFASALNMSDAQALKDTLWLLNHILSREPTRINTRLNHAASLIRLSELLEAMTRIVENLHSLEVDLNQLELFHTGTTALAAFDHQLSGLVDEHNRWQMVEDDLRLMESDPDDMEKSWRYVKRKAQPLYSGIEERWALAILESSAKLDDALASQNPTLVRQYFRAYYARARNRFYEVDVDLKRLCDELRKVGESLNAVLRWIT